MAKYGLHSGMEMQMDRMEEDGGESQISKVNLNNRKCSCVPSGPDGNPYAEKVEARKRRAQCSNGTEKEMSRRVV